MSLLKNATCKVEAEINGVARELGTGFFISSNQILTLNHVIEDCKGEICISKCYGQDKDDKLTAKVVDKCEICDFALLELNEDFRNNYILDLCKSEVIEGEKWNSFGYLNIEEGQVFGENLEGTIKMVIENDNELPQDLNLYVVPTIKSDYSGFSGSPILNEYGDVISIMKYQTERHLSAVSIKKAKPFLDKNGIQLKPDRLSSFETYSDKVFTGFEGRKNECEVESKKVMKNHSPQSILELRKGELFYPQKKQTLDEIINYLRKTKDINTKLWKGWIQLLTYVELLKGECQNANHIQIKIHSNEVYKKFGLFKKEKNISISLNLNFFFTEDESYFKVARLYIHNEIEKDKLTMHTCNIFNSHQDNFGCKIIENISCPENSGPSIQNVKVGALSLKQLNEEVIKSDSLLMASNNLENLFINAIK